MTGIAVTGQPDIDQATAEIAIVLRDAGYGKREQDCYDEAARLRDVIMAGTRALDAEVPVTHTGMAEHDGYAAHSHEVRPDHRGVHRGVTA